MSDLEQACAPRRIISEEPDEQGYAVEYDCGHKSWWATKPPTIPITCAQCVVEYLDQKRQDRRIEP